MSEGERGITAASVDARVDKLEAVYDERLSAIRKEIVGMAAAQAAAMSEIKGIFKWAGGIVVSIVIASAGWGISQQFAAARSDHETERAQRDNERTQLNLLQSQMQTWQASTKNAPAATVNVQQPAPRDPMLDPAPTVQPGAAAQ